MSYAATQWAIDAPGLKPAAKMVLIWLARVNSAARGCFPSQEWLAAKCEMARSTVVAHLATLERRGLISRVRTGGASRHGTRYVLNLSGPGSHDRSPAPVAARGEGRRFGRGSGGVCAEAPCPGTGRGDMPGMLPDIGPKQGPTLDRISRGTSQGLKERLARDPVGDASPSAALSPGDALKVAGLIAFLAGRRAVPASWIGDGDLIARSVRSGDLLPGHVDALAKIMPGSVSAMNVCAQSEYLL